jgi:hypothetical protein
MLTAAGSPASLETIWISAFSMPQRTAAALHSPTAQIALAKRRAELGGILGASYECATFAPRRAPRARFIRAAPCAGRSLHRLAARMPRMSRCSKNKLNQTMNAHHTR